VILVDSSVYTGSFVTAEMRTRRQCITEAVPRLSALKLGMTSRGSHAVLQTVELLLLHVCSLLTDNI